MTTPPRIYPMGDRAVLVEFGSRIDAALSRRIAALARRLRAQPPAGVLDVVPAYTTLAVHYDPAALGAGAYEALAQSLGTWLTREAGDEPPPARTVEIPVCYGGAYGEDLEAVASRCGMTAAGVVALHSGAAYHVHMLGFVPGFAYLGGLDARLAVPRRDSPRTRVPAGSVAIAGGQTAVYPLDTPGGWHIIGRTPLKLFRADAVPPCLLDAGDGVRFVAIPEARFTALAGGPA
ncbi:MAG TPA: 5-oxoprolinase subunit PxpB [Burkholderiales bacterium]|nr:5-oxoprolinase subunit PxpB [Burkholderiales bacterium]